MTVHPRYTIRTLVVDDHQVVCQRFHGFLNGKSDRGPSVRRRRPPGTGRARMGRHPAGPFGDNDQGGMSDATVLVPIRLTANCLDSCRSRVTPVDEDEPSTCMDGR
jgi:hypothetical protein